jgi:hypothetical protein
MVRQLKTIQNTNETKTMMSRRCHHRCHRIPPPPGRVQEGVDGVVSRPVALL